MRFTTSLLSSAALLAMGTVGFAADLPSKKAAPVEYVRICSQFGAGFFYIPGSDTCLKLSGRVRADYIYTQPLTRATNTTTMRARGYFAFDTFTATDWGPLRATSRIYVTRDSGRGAGNFNGQNISTGNATTAADIALDWAYIQFAGVTAGRIAVSFFEFAPFGGVTYLGGGSNGRGSDYGAIDTLAYTATFGGGFSATLALEDGTERRNAALQGASATFLTNGILAATAPTYGGHVMPDLVGRLDYTGTWGSAALTGAVHQIRVGNGAGNVFGPTATIGDTEYGYAIQGGVKVNLPMLAPGDALFLQAAYANGANSYTGWSSIGIGTQPNLVNGITTPDVVYDQLGNGHTTTSWALSGGLLHYWLPTLRQGLAVAYGKLDIYGPWYDAAAVTVATNLIWSPVKGFDIGAEVGWQKLSDVPNIVYAPQNVAAGSLVGLKNDNWFGRLRFQRDF
jgi:hypothetical protein